MNIWIVYMIIRSIKLVHKANVFVKSSYLPDFGGEDTDR